MLQRGQMLRPVEGANVHELGIRLGRSSPGVDLGDCQLNGAACVLLSGVFRFVQGQCALVPLAVFHSEKRTSHA